MPIVSRLPVNSNGPYHVCTKCGVTKAVGDFYKKSPVEIFSRCKTCVIRQQCQWSKANRAKCTAYVRARRQADPEASRAATKKWRDANPEKVRAMERAYKAAHPEQVAAKKKRYAATHREVIRAADARYRERLGLKALRERHKAWRDANPHHRETLNAAKHRRRARLAGQGGSHTPAEWAALKLFYDYTCLMCGRREPEVVLTKDHVVPIVEGGTDDIVNCQPLCKSCNSRKHRKVIDLR